MVGHHRLVLLLARAIPNPQGDRRFPDIDDPFVELDCNCWVYLPVFVRAEEVPVQEMRLAGAEGSDQAQLYPLGVLLLRHRIEIN